MKLPCPVLLLLGACLLVTVGHVSGQSYDGYRPPTEWAVRDFPDPYSLNQDQQRRCGRLGRSSVCDPNAIISKYEADQIDTAIEDVYRNTSCPCDAVSCQNHNKGYIIRVAIMPRMKRIFPSSGNSSYMRLRDAEMYSYMLTLQWKMGGLCNESMLILFSKYDDILYTLTHIKTAEKISDDDVKSVSLSVRSYFDNNETIAEGILEMIRRYKAILKRPPPP